MPSEHREPDAGRPEEPRPEKDPAGVPPESDSDSHRHVSGERAPEATILPSATTVRNLRGRSIE